MTGFADPALERLWREVHAARERRGAAGDARVVLPDLTDEEAFAIDGLPWPGRRRPLLPHTPLKTTISRVEAAVAAAGGDLDAIVSATVGRAPRDLPAESRARRERRREFLAWLASHPVVRAHSGLAAWSAHVRRTGVPGPADRKLVAQALAVVAALPRTPPVSRSTLAAQLLNGRAHALDSETPLGKLATTLLSWRAGHADGRLDPIETRELWLADGVEVDPLSCTVLSLGLVPVGDVPLARALRTLRGQAVVLTYAQLRAQRLRWPGRMAVFTCENPVVVRAAELALGPTCPPLVCTGGWPNAAVLSLLDDLRAAAATIRHNGDGDAAGAMIFEHLEERLHAVPWRREASPRPDGRQPNRGRPLACEPEELMLDVLIDDLRCAA